MSNRPRTPHHQHRPANSDNAEQAKHSLGATEFDVLKPIHVPAPGSINGVVRVEAGSVVTLREHDDDDGINETQAKRLLRHECIAPRKAGSDRKSDD